MIQEHAPAPPAPRLSLAEQLEQVTVAQMRAHEAWKRMRDAQAEWERAQVAAELRMGSFLMEIDVVIGCGDGQLHA